MFSSVIVFVVASPDMEMLEREMEAWMPYCNAVTRGVGWRFTTENVYLKLKRLYPKFETG